MTSDGVDSNPIWVYVVQSGSVDFDGHGDWWNAFDVVLDGSAGELPFSWTSPAPLLWEHCCDIVRETTASHPSARVLARLSTGTYRLEGLGGEWPRLSRESFTVWDSETVPPGLALPKPEGELELSVRYAFAGPPTAFEAPSGWITQVTRPIVSLPDDSQTGVATVTVPDRKTGLEGYWGERVVLNALSGTHLALRSDPALSNSEDERREAELNEESAEDADEVYVPKGFIFGSNIRSPPSSG